MIIDGVKVSKDFACSREELEMYVAYARDKVNGLKEMTLHLRGNEVDIAYVAHEPFERIRRITGYLVGTLERWNDSKQAEERERVKHEA